MGWVTMREVTAWVFYIVGDVAHNISQRLFMMSDRIQGPTANGPWLEEVKDDDSSYSQTTKMHPLARKLAWWTSYINRTSTNEDVIADSANDAAYAYAVLRSLGVSEETIQKLSSATY